MHVSKFLENNYFGKKRKVIARQGEDNLEFPIHAIHHSSSGEMPRQTPALLRRISACRINFVISRGV